jgi:D-mannonate dehydratase
MTDFNWMRTSTSTISRGGSVVTSFDNNLMKDAPLTENGPISEEKLWETLEYFLKKVLPVAEKWNVKLACIQTTLHSRPFGVSGALCGVLRISSGCLISFPAR